MNITILKIIWLNPNVFLSNSNSIVLYHLKNHSEKGFTGFTRPKRLCGTQKFKKLHSIRYTPNSFVIFSCSLLDKEHFLVQYEPMRILLNDYFELELRIESASL